MCIDILLIWLLYLSLHPQNKLRRFIFGLVTSQAFNIIIMVLICFQAITLMIQSDEQSRQMDTAVLWLQILFILLYTGECVLKLIAFRCNYFMSGWNVLDFIVVIFSITGKILCSQIFICINIHSGKFF